MKKMRPRLNNLNDRFTLLEMDDVMSLLGIKSKVTLYKLMDKEKVLPYRKIGKARKFKLEDIHQYLETCLVSHQR